MKILLRNSKLATFNSQLSITGSKSETNRLLLLQALFPEIQIENASNSDDSDVMQKELQKLLTEFCQLPTEIDVHHAGTAMRFLTAFFSIQEDKEVILTGSSRMKERPIKILVDALNQLGAEISYEEKEGFPPIKIKGKKLTQNKVSLAANVSSQYISALLLIAPKLENGLELILDSEITSVPYIKMTLKLLNEIGVQTTFIENRITIKPLLSTFCNLLFVESDWSSASYWYSIIALSKIGIQITLSSFKKNSLQGDFVLSEIYKEFGVETIFNNDNSITIIKSANCKLQSLVCNLQSAPDIAQTIAVTCFGLGMGCHLSGLHTLKIKETDRLIALKNELTKLGAVISVTQNSLKLEPSKKIAQKIEIKTYDDHRMAMAFAPLALKVPIIIENAEVVSKSYPTFWDDLKCIGFEIVEIGN